MNDDGKNTPTRSTAIVSQHGIFNTAINITTQILLIKPYVTHGGDHIAALTLLYLQVKTIVTVREH